MAVLKANGSFLKVNGKMLVRQSIPITEQEWTNDNVPTGLQTLHDFGDGLGEVPAIPLDSSAISDTIISMATRKVVYRESDSSAISDTIISMATRKVVYRESDSSAISDTIISFEVTTND